MALNDDGVPPSSAVSDQSARTGIDSQLEALRAEVADKVGSEQADMECLKVHVRLDELTAEVRAMRTALDQLADVVGRVQR